MRHIVTISVAAALALGLAAYSGDAGQRKGAGSSDQIQKVEQQRDQEQQALQRTRQPSKR